MISYPKEYQNMQKLASISKNQSNPQDWVWEVFSLYKVLFAILPPFIVTLNVKSRRAEAQASKLKRFIWKWSVTVCITCLTLSCMYVLVKWSRDPKSVLPHHTFAALGLLALSALAGYTCHIHYIYREDHVFGVNILLNLHSAKIKETSRVGRNARNRKNQKKSLDLKQSIFRYTLIGLITGIFAIQVFMPLVLFEGLDPARYVLFDLVPTKLFDHYPIHVTLAVFLARFIIFAHMMLEMSRFFAAFFLILISGIIIYIDYIERVLEVKERMSEPPTMLAVKEFTYIRLIVHILNPILKGEICCLMFLGFIISVGSNVAVIQFWELLPFYVYVSAAGVSLCCIVIIYATLPFGTEVNEKTGNALGRWKLSLYKRPNDKYLHLVIRSLRPVSVRCGPFFKLQRETKATFFEAILGFTSDIIISFDMPAVFKNGVTKMINRG